jgi:hypothetical protein
MDDVMGSNVAENEVVISNTDYAAAEQSMIDSQKPRIPEGEHIFAVTSYEYGVSQKNNPQIIWVLTKVSGAPTEGLGLAVKHYTQLNNFNLYGFLSALGVTKELTPEVFQADGLHLSNALLLNRMVKIKIVHNKKLKPDSEGKDPSTLTDLDYNIFANPKSVYPYEEIGKRFTGELGIVNNSNNDMPFA